MSDKANKLLAQVLENPEEYTPLNQRGSGNQVPPKRPQMSPELQKRIAARAQNQQIDMRNRTEKVTPEGPTKEPERSYAAAVADGSGISVALPSKFAFYDFPDLYVGNLTGANVSKFFAAYSQQSMPILVEAISSILTTSAPHYKGMSVAHRLTIPDFYWVLYYLRSTQVSKVSFTHKTTCRNPEHHKAVQEGKRSKESLRIVETIANSQLVTKEFDRIPDLDAYNALMPEGITLSPSTMMDTIHAVEDPDFGKSDEYLFNSRLASMLRVKGNPGATIKRRIEIVNGMSFEQLEAISNFETAASSYGVDEYVLVTCRECGHQQKSKISVDARDFLPTHLRGLPSA